MISTQDVKKRAAILKDYLEQEKITHSSQDVIKQAAILKDYLKQKDIKLGQQSCLHAISKINGFENWQTMSAIIKRLEQSQGDTTK